MSIIKLPLTFLILACTLLQCALGVAHANQAQFNQGLNASMLSRTTFVLDSIPLNNDSISGDVFESKLAYKMDENQSLHQAIETANALSDTLLGNAFPLGYNATIRTAHTAVKNDSEIYVLVHTQIVGNTIKNEDLDEVARLRYLALVESSLSNQEILTANLANNYRF